MGEINGPNFKVNSVNFSSTQKQTPDIPQGAMEEENPKFKDFSNPKAEALGRSLVKDSDSTNQDLKVLLNNPQVAENSDKLFEVAYKAAVDKGVSNPYEQAADFSTGKV